MGLKDVGSQAVDVFTTGRRDGPQRTVLLLLTCSLFSLLLSSLLALYLLFTLSYGLAVVGGIAGCFGTLLTVALFLSQRIRCLGTLFVISVFMKKSRNLLLAAGTSLVVFRNIRNASENLTSLVRSMICNLKTKKEAVQDSFLNFQKASKWLEDRVGEFRHVSGITFDFSFNVSPRLESEQFKEKLAETEQKLNETVQYVQTNMHIISSVVERLFPAISFVLLMLFITLHIKRFCRDIKYENRFICSRFVSFDKEQKDKGKPHVLPLSPEEETLYPTIPSARPTIREGKAMLKFGVPVIFYFAIWVIFIALDALMYYFVEIVTTRFSELEQVSVPMSVNFFGNALLGELPVKTRLAAKEFPYYMTPVEKKCLPEPKLLLYDSVGPLAAILGILFIMALLAPKVGQLMLLLCERFFSSAAEARVTYLHGKILKRRLKKTPSYLEPVQSKPQSKLLFFRRKEDAESRM